MESKESKLEVQKKTMQALHSAEKILAEQWPKDPRYRAL